MIFEIGRPLVFLGMGLGFVIAVLVHNLAQAIAGRALGDPATRLNRRKLVDPKREFEAFGIIAMVIGGVGWGRPVPLTEPRTRGGNKRRYLTALLAGPAADILLGLAAVLAYALLSSASPVTAGVQSAAVESNAGYELLGIIGVICVSIGVLYLIPLPPLDGARIMWALAPPSAGWQKARYNLEEQNYGLGALVVLSLPLFGGVGLVIRIVNAVARPLIDAVVNAVL